mgnify:CR=1 FL=1
MIGALAAIGELPLNRGRFESVISRSMTTAKLKTNLIAYDMGVSLVN